MPILTQPGKIHDNIYLIDTLQYGIKETASCFAYWNNDICLLMDVGTSDSAKILMDTLENLEIPFSKVRGIVITHYHFDHGGGCSALWKRMVKKNPDFKIIVTQDNHDRLQDSQLHLKTAKSTFGKLVGTMEPAPEEAFEIVQKDVDLPIDLGQGYTIRLISTPGHCPEHCCPTIYKNSAPVFCFAGEACGALSQKSKLISTPTSMPPHFNFDSYMESCTKIRDLGAKYMGLCHFGAIKEQTDIITFIESHLQDMKRFRDAIIKAYKENPSTRYVVEQVISVWEDNYEKKSHSPEGFLQSLMLALTYGPMIDLGYRKPKYEE